MKVTDMNRKEFRRADIVARAAYSIHRTGSCHHAEPDP